MTAPAHEALGYEPVLFDLVASIVALPAAPAALTTPPAQWSWLPTTTRRSSRRPLP